MFGNSSRGSFLLSRVIIICIQIVIFAGASTAYAQCPAITNHGWPQNAVVRFVIDNTFNEEQKRQIRAATSEWTRANSLNNSRVSFVEDTSGQNFSLRFLTGPLPQGNPANFTGTFDAATGTVKTANITYDPNNIFPGTNFLVADPAQPGYSTIVTKLILHEMGHLMGLDHPFIPANLCDQPDGATVLNYVCGVNDQANNIPTTVAACDQNAINSETIYPPVNTPAPTIQIDASSVTNPFNEGAGRADVLVTRTGNTSTVASVDYVTSDAAGLTNCNVFNGVASSRCDYGTAVRTLRFAAGETQKTISIPLVDDGYVEGNESFSLSLSSPVGATLATPSAATITIQDNDSISSNPINNASFFVRQHYIDFLEREPDPLAAGWVTQLNACGAGDQSCRISVSQGIYLSPEFRDRGYFVYKFYSVALGRKPDYAEFIPDRARVSGFQTEAELEQSKQDFALNFMTRAAFASAYNGLSDNAYVQRLFDTAGVTQVTVSGVVHTVSTMQGALASGTKTRASVLRDIVESPEVSARFLTEATIVMHYFGYLRRDPDAFYQDWIAIFNQTGDSRNVTNGFINSPEYRMRFGP